MSEKCLKSLPVIHNNDVVLLKYQTIKLHLEHLFESVTFFMIQGCVQSMQSVDKWLLKCLLYVQLFHSSYFYIEKLTLKGVNFVCRMVFFGRNMEEKSTLVDFFPQSVEKVCIQCVRRSKAFKIYVFFVNNCTCTLIYLTQTFLIPINEFKQTYWVWVNLKCPVCLLAPLRLLQTQEQPKNIVCKSKATESSNHINHIGQRPFGIYKYTRVHSSAKSFSAKKNCYFFLNRGQVPRTVHKSDFSVKHFIKHVI